MKRRLRIRKWLVLGVAVVALSLVSSAQAVLYSGDTGISGAKPAQPVATTGSGFDWTDAAIGVGVGLAVAVAGLAALEITRNRRRLAALH